MATIKIIDSIDPDFLWSKEYVPFKAYFEALLSVKSENLIKNVKTNVKILQIDNHFCPIAINSPGSGNSFIHSFEALIESVKKQMKTHTNWFIRNSMPFVMHIASLCAKKLSFDKAVLVDHWLFLSSNNYPAIGKNALVQATEFLTTTFPDHAICFSAVNVHIHSHLMHNLLDIGYQTCPLKTTILFDQERNDFLLRTNVKNDFSLMQKSLLQQVSHHQIVFTDYKRIIELYNMVYLNKYAENHLQLTEKFIAICHEHDIVHLNGLRNEEGILEGIIGYFVKNDVMIGSFVGYNVRLPKKLGIYRILMAMQLQDAVKKKVVLNAGSGVLHFKKLRGGIESVDYLACFYQHLQGGRRCGFHLFGKMFHTFGNYLIKLMS